jgi:hypothetical protein
LFFSFFGNPECEPSTLNKNKEQSTKHKAQSTKHTVCTYTIHRGQRAEGTRLLAYSRQFSVPLLVGRNFERLKTAGLPRDNRNCIGVGIGVGIALELHWSCIGVALELHRCSLLLSLLQLTAPNNRNCIGVGIALESELHWSCIGVALELHWSCIGVAPLLPPPVSSATNSTQQSELHWSRNCIGVGIALELELRYWSRSCIIGVGIALLESELN